MIWPVDLFKVILAQVGGTSAYGDGVIETLRKIVEAEGGSVRYFDGPVRLLKKWLDAIGGTSLYSDTAEATLKKILAAYGGSPNYNRNMRQTAEAIVAETAGCTIPTLVSATIDVTGELITLVFTEEVTGTGAGFTVNTDTDTLTLTYVSGDGTNTLVFSLSSPALEGESATIEYEDTVGNVQSGPECPLATFNAPVTNNTGQFFFRITSVGDTRVTSTGDSRTIT